MAISSCIKCGGSSFELKEHEPRWSQYAVHFVQCSACGGVVGVLEYTNTEYLIRKLAEKLRVDLDG